MLPPRLGPVKKLSLVLLIALTAMGACRPDELDLSYRYPENGEISYRMEARAHADWDIGGQGTGSYRVTFDVVETVRAIDGEAVTVDVVMTPTSVQEDGLPSPGTEERAFSLRIDRNGEVIDVLEVDGVAATALDPDELAFIGTYRPPLPVESVGLHERWTSKLEVEVGNVFQQVSTEAVLERLDRDGEGRVAEIGYSGEGPLVWTTTLPQGEADLTGSATTRSDALLDIDGGFLRAASSTTEGSFEVRVVAGEERAPIRGRLEFRLDLKLTKGS